MSGCNEHYEIVMEGHRYTREHFKVEPKGYVGHIPAAVWEASLDAVLEAFPTLLAERDDALAQLAITERALETSVDQEDELRLRLYNVREQRDDALAATAKLRDAANAVIDLAWEHEDKRMDFYVVDGPTLRALEAAYDATAALQGDTET